ncbi:phosphate ABC transporter substrate-binding protein [Lysobacter concretionis Ko07 = DSM 16239]|uniref:Phosphate-binding protein PstS n=1 Tax=Lysobacter concretionis Ko07 = DSM 16239 TaxID=1122185 RepID=A0A0A0ET77_9GAMM|nr:MULTISPECIES: phosphate ABC transporter substrate-binding protein PstS [Lysobacter]KGM52327.1 phosphate ABC transporter substrate-binding protein [Lysobacter concretionis Ko07 = DSM 16239]QOD92388.1 phosphate ABC transporter substrate-binding protein PstS [Lysobacter sp. CW239]
MEHSVFKSLSFRFTALALATAFSASAAAADVTGAGASFIYPVMTQWSADYAKSTGHKVNYQSIGSGGGIAQIKAATVDFGSSDAPLTPEELSKHGLAQFPSVIGGVVPVLNVPGIAAGAMKLDGDVLADIFLGRISRWNDPRIVASNAGLALPDLKITIVHRSDGSGTTFNFVNYLSKVSPAWKDSVGEGTSVKWPGGIGGKGNEGVAAYVKQIKGGIGYVEMSYALQNQMTYSRLKNAAGNYIIPSDKTFSAAAASADWGSSRDFHLVMTNAPGEQAWPITATNFILMYKQPKDAAGASSAKAFFRWVYANGDAAASKLDYVPLPDTLVEQIETYWSKEMAY